MNTVSFLPTLWAQFLSGNEGVGDTGGGAICEQRVWPQAVQLGRWRPSAGEQGDPCSSREQSPGKGKGPRKVWGGNPGHENLIWGSVCVFVKGGFQAKPAGPTITCCSCWRGEVLGSGRGGTLILKAVASSAKDTSPGIATQGKSYYAWNHRRLGNWARPSSARKLCPAAGHPGSDCAKIPLLPHMFPEISVLGNERDCSREPELPTVLKPPQAGISHRAGSQPRKRGPEKGGWQDSGASGPCRHQAFASCQPYLFSVSFYQAGSLWPGVNSTKSRPLPLRSSQFKKRTNTRKQTHGYRDQSHGCQRGEVRGQNEWGGFRGTHPWGNMKVRGCNAQHRRYSNVL